jgi:hypothetical protein
MPYHCRRLTHPHLHSQAENKVDNNYCCLTELLHLMLYGKTLIVQTILWAGWSGRGSNQINDVRIKNTNNHNII